ncbi:MAG: glycosyltransferase family 4 protein [Treponema sp.]|nr:glycosyltransferase family 4 protein [Treponema sp.]
MNTKKNIAILIGDISESAGTERAVTNLSNILQNSGKYQVVIISHYSENGNTCYYPLNSDVIIEHLEMQNKGLFDRLKKSKLLLRKIEELCKRYQIEILIGTTHGYNIQLSKLVGNVKKIGCEHINYDSAPLYSRVLRKLTYPKLDAVVCLTQKDSEKYRFVGNNKVFVIPNSLSFAVESPAKLENKKIIAVGRLTKQKGWDYLVAAASKIKESLPDWHIDIFGCGEEEENLLMQIKNNHTDDYVSIRSPTPDIKKEMLDSSIMVETSRWEGFPMVLLEAQACGLPLVGFDCPEGPADIIRNGECGYLVPVGNIGKFADCVVKIASDLQLRKKMGQSSFELAKRFSSENIGSKWFELFDSLLESK